MSEHFTATYEITIAESAHSVRVRALDPAGATDGRYAIAIDGADEIIIHGTRPQAGIISMLVGDHTWDVGVSDDEDGFVVDVMGVSHAVGVIDPKRKALRTAGAEGAGVIKTQMPGRVVRVLVAEGDMVAKGDPVFIVEAMKMENELKAPRAGLVRRVCVAEGDLVEAKAVLLELDAPAD